MAKLYNYTRALLNHYPSFSELSLSRWINKFRFSIVGIVISVSNVTSPFDCSFRLGCSLMEVHKFERGKKVETVGEKKVENRLKVN